MGRILLPFFAFFLISPADFLGFQSAAREQAAAVKKIPPTTHWTEDARQRLLARAQQGDANSQMWLATAYEQGWFGEVNIAEALRWFRKSAANGNPDAQNDLGRMYEDGEGVEQNFVLAAKWYQKAAEHVPNLGGAGQGRNNLGMLYLEGRGVPKDYVQAYVWFRLSGFGENANLVAAKSQLTQAQILEAEQRVVQWKIRHHDRLDSPVESK